MSDENKAVLKEIFEWGYCIIIAVVLALLVKYYVGIPTIVQQSSMVPTFNSNDRLILNRLYRTTKKVPQRGEIITFEAPSSNYVEEENIYLDNPTAIYEQEHNGIISKFLYNVIELGKVSYIKRVIALPGEHIEIKDGKVYINGDILKEDYLPDDLETQSEGGQYIDLVVPEGTVYVMGDNRGHSADSRRFGCIPYDKIEGKVVFRFWPLNVFGAIK